MARKISHWDAADTLETRDDIAESLGLPLSVAA